jgi:homoaconitase/3-isopropylmalate dehydratase large subunit
VNYWSSLVSDADATYDKEVVIDAKDISPTVTWGTSPQDVVSIDGVVVRAPLPYIVSINLIASLAVSLFIAQPDPADYKSVDPSRVSSMQRSLDYMGLLPGTKLDGVPVDKVFIGSCTNARIEDIREAAAVAKGRKVAPNVKHAMVVPGSGTVHLPTTLETE